MAPIEAGRRQGPGTILARCWPDFRAYIFLAEFPAIFPQHPDQLYGEVWTHTQHEKQEPDHMPVECGAVSQLLTNVSS